MKTTPELSKRDKQTIQSVTRYADVMRERPYEFEIRFGKVRLGKHGTTSHAQFSDVQSDDAQMVQKYLSQLAVFAFQRLARKYGSASRSMIHSVVMVYSVKRVYQLNLGELVLEHFDTPILHS